MRNSQFVVTAAFAAVLCFSLAKTVQGQAQPFGAKDDVTFAEKLWSALNDAKLVGPDRIHVRPFEGNEPHGSIQQVLDTTIAVAGREARVIVKVNHGGADVSVLSVHREPNKNLGAYTVMFKRETGYDSENVNWFWAKYGKDGTLDKNPKGVRLAGRVAKGMDQGCIACHTALGGDNREILDDR